VAWAIIIIPIALTKLDITRRLLVVFAWAYVIGQTISIGYGLALGISADGGRGGGWTTHPNFYGLAGQLAVALCIFLFYETPRRHRWIVVGATVVMLYSVIDSGSRASLLAVAVTVLMWPLVERSVFSVYTLLAGAAVTVSLANYLIANAPAGSALARLGGEGSASASSLQREQSFQSGLERFFDNPIKGNGFNDILDIHSVYLEVAVGGGIIALFGFLFVIAALIQPLFRMGTNAPNRLAYMGVSYAVWAPIGPTLYDRLLWAALALIIATHALGTEDENDGAEEAEEPAEEPARRATGRRAPPLRS
jgi:O-antigen ligase